VQLYFLQKINDALFLAHVLFGAMDRMNKLYNIVLTFPEVKFLQESRILTETSQMARQIHS